jgi:hypothetical protein
MGTKGWARVKKGWAWDQKGGHGLKRVGTGSKGWVRIKKTGHGIKKVGTGFKQGGPWDVVERLWYTGSTEGHLRGNMDKNPSFKVRSLISFFINMYEYLLVIPTTYHIPPTPGTGSEGWARDLWRVSIGSTERNRRDQKEVTFLSKSGACIISLGMRTSIYLLA